MGKSYQYIHDDVTLHDVHQNARNEWTIRHKKRDVLLCQNFNNSHESLNFLKGLEVKDYLAPITVVGYVEYVMIAQNSYRKISYIEPIESEDERSELVKKIKREFGGTICFWSLKKA